MHTRKTSLQRPLVKNVSGGQIITIQLLGNEETEIMTTLIQEIILNDYDSLTVI
jgi:hypothetical protein